MNRASLIAASLLIIALAAGGIWYARAPKAADAGLPPAASAADAREVLYWYDPMKPDVHFDEPGPSPFMDMALVPKYRQADRGEGLVSIDPRMAQNLGVRAVPVERGTFWQRIDTVGSVAIDDRRIRVIESRASGWIESQTVHTVGATVRRGERVAGVYSPALYAAQQEYVLALRAGEAALAEASRQRLRLLGATEAQVDGVRRRGTAERELSLVSPIDGVVIDLDANEGRQIGPGMPLMRIADLARVWVYADIPEAQADWIAQGRPAEVQLRGRSASVLEGKVDYLYPTVDATSRTVRARLVFDNPDGLLRPGMYVDVTLYGGARRDVLTVPSEALIRTGARNTVIVAEGEGRFRPVSVELGPERRGRTVIVGGLEEAQQVVVSGQFLIDSEANLQGAYERMEEEAPHASPLTPHGQNP
ncbi:MAG: efflux RND transporter periplasmic adaptor subunit [Pseudomonadota bacterium]|nr:efflux RND transporter periplasmic adaptor subunit [Pseudomonadota bacterium]